MIEKDKLIEIGKFQRTHALKGELNAILDVPEEYVEEGNPLVVFTEGIPVPYYAESIRPKGATSFLIKLEGVDSMEEASELVNAAIYADKAALGEYMEEDMMLEDDLHGFRVVDSAAGDIGELYYIDDSTENRLLVVDGHDGEEIFIPLAEGILTEIDEEHRTIHTSLPEGLLDLNRKNDGRTDEI